MGNATDNDAEKSLNKAKQESSQSLMGGRVRVRVSRVFFPSRLGARLTLNTHFTSAAVRRCIVRLGSVAPDGGASSKLTQRP